MGAIQDSLNSMMTTAALGAAGMKHLAEQHQADQMKMADLKSDVAEKESEIKELGEAKDAIAAENPEIGSQVEGDMLSIEDAQGGEELLKAKKAMDSLSDKITAKTAQKEALERTMASVGKTPMQIMREGGARQIKAFGRELKKMFGFGGKK